MLVYQAVHAGDAQIEAMVEQGRRLRCLGILFMTDEMNRGYGVYANENTLFLRYV